MKAAVEGLGFASLILPPFHQVWYLPSTLFHNRSLSTTYARFYLITTIMPYTPRTVLFSQCPDYTLVSSSRLTNLWTFSGILVLTSFVVLCISIDEISQANHGVLKSAPATAIFGTAAAGYTLTLLLGLYGTAILDPLFKNWHYNRLYLNKSSTSVSSGWIFAMEIFLLFLAYVIWGWVGTIGSLEANFLEKALDDDINSCGRVCAEIKVSRAFGFAHSIISASQFIRHSYRKKSDRRFT